MSTFNSGVLISMAVLFLAGASPAAPSSKAPLAGTVKSADKKPMEGVAVSARADGKTFTTTVYTARDGSYFFPPLEEGQYKVWAQAVGFDAGRSAAKLSPDKTAEQNFELKPLRDFSRQLSGIEWMASLPEDTSQDRRAKRIFGVNCIQCHAIGFVLQNRFDAAGWAAILNFMEKGSDKGLPYPHDRTNPFIHGYKDELVAYLARARGPNSTLTYHPLPRPTGESTHVVVTEYDVSPGHLPGYLVTQNGSDWSKGTPSRHESGATHDCVVDPQGYVWFGDNVSPERTLGKLDPKTGRVTDYTLRTQKDNLPVNAHDMFVDDIGRIWFNDGAEGTLDYFDSKAEKFHHFPRPDSVPPGVGRLIDEDSKGNMWEGIQGRAVSKYDPVWKINYQAPDPQQPGGAMKLNPKTGEYTFYRAVTPALTVYGVGVDGQDNVWFTQSGPDRLGIVNGNTSKVSELSISAPDRDTIEHNALDKELASKFETIDQYGPPWQKGPRRQASDRKNGIQWITLSKSSAIAKVDIRTRKVTEYPTPYPYSFPYAAAVDNNHMVWVSYTNADRLSKFNPVTEKWTDYPLPTLGTDVRLISLDNSTDPLTIWIPYWQSSKLARIQFRAAAAVNSVAAR